MIFETIMPGIGNYDSWDPAFIQSDINTTNGMCDFGTHYATVGFNSLDTLYAAQNKPELFQTFSERIGYRLRPSIVWKTREDQVECSLILGMVNDGAVTPPGIVTFYAGSQGDEVSAEISGSHLSNKMYLVELPISKLRGNQIEIRMELTLGMKKYPIRFSTDIGQKEAPYVLQVNLEH